MTKIRKTPFVEAEIVTGGSTSETIRYSYGFNMSGTHQPEVLQIVRSPDGIENTYVIMRGLSQVKAQFIAMILNAPEG